MVEATKQQVYIYFKKIVHTLTINMNLDQFVPLDFAENGWNESPQACGRSVEACERRLFVAGLNAEKQQQQQLNIILIIRIDKHVVF